MEKSEEKTIEIMCDDKSQFLVEGEEGAKIKKNIEDVADAICSYKSPVKLMIRTHYMSKSDRYLIEKIASLHNMLYYAKKEIDDAVKKLETSD